MTLGVSVKQTTEIIAFASGKGGTGKTIIASSLGYALIRSGQRVLMVDCDPATHGLSLFLLGPKGMLQAEHFEDTETFVGVLSRFNKTGELRVIPRPIHRLESGDHGVSYNAVISGRGVYGDLPDIGGVHAVPDLDQNSFRSAVAALFSKIRDSGEYSYVLVDTRGGFAFESTDVCALADSFIVVTEPNYTSFYQDRNLIKRISGAAKELDTRPLLRSVIVNKATEAQVSPDGRMSLDTLEASFRVELEREFPLKFKDTHAVPLDLEAIRAYNIQAVPYVVAPGAPFSYATLSAFGDILQIVTSRWSAEQVSGWNVLIDLVTSALEARYEKARKEKEEAIAKLSEVENLRRQVEEYKARIESLEREASRTEAQYQRELERTAAIWSKLESTVPRALSDAPSLQQRSRKLSRFGWSMGIVAAIILVGALTIMERPRSLQSPATRIEATVPTIPSVQIQGEWIDDDKSLFEVKQDGSNLLFSGPETKGFSKDAKGHYTGSNTFVMRWPRYGDFTGTVAFDSKTIIWNTGTRWNRVSFYPTSHKKKNSATRP